MKRKISKSIANLKISLGILLFPSLALSSENVITLLFLQEGASQRIVLGTKNGASHFFDPVYDVPALFDGGEKLIAYILKENSGFEGVTQFWRDFVTQAPYSWTINVKTSSSKALTIWWEIKNSNSFKNECFLEEVYLEDRNGKKILMTLDTSYYIPDPRPEESFRVTLTDNRIPVVSEVKNINFIKKGSFALISWDRAQSMTGDIKGYEIFAFDNGNRKKIQGKWIEDNKILLKLSGKGPHLLGIHALNSQNCRGKTVMFEVP